MILVGRTQRLNMVERSDHGAILTDGERKLLLPNKYVPAALRPGDPIDVFVTTDSMDRLYATTRKPAGEVGDLVTLQVQETTPVGAFLDWGLEKDLLLPFGQQRRPVRESEWVVARILLDDKTQRVIASTKLTHLLNKPVRIYAQGDEINGIILETDDNGARVIVDEAALGRIFPDELHQRVRVGEKFRLIVKRVRDDGALALSFTRGGLGGTVALGPTLLARLEQAGGFLPYSDNSSPEEIREAFGCSKGTFKKAIGMLMKEGKISIEFHGIRLGPPKKGPGK